MNLAPLRARVLTLLGLPALGGCLTAEAAAPPSEPAARGAQAAPRRPAQGATATPHPPRPARAGHRWDCGPHYGCLYERNAPAARAAPAPHQRCLRSVTGADNPTEPTPHGVPSLPGGTAAVFDTEHTAQVRAQGNYTLCCYSWTGCVEEREPETRMQMMIGRALRAEPEAPAQQARPEAREDWLAALSLEVAALSPSERARVAAAWAHCAAVEHASVAAFARVSLELLALGAPSELVARTHRAALEEVEHARLSFGVASCVAGEALGPGPLAAALAPFAELRFASVLEGAWRDGCIAEAVAALLALEAAESAEAPALRALQERLAREESQHAELAWAVVRWAAEQSAEAREKLRALTEEAALELAQGAASGLPREPLLERWGLPSEASASALRHALLREVVVPCGRALHVALAAS